MVVLVWENKALVYSNVQYILSDFFFFFLIYTLVFNFTHQQIGSQNLRILWIFTAILLVGNVILN